MPGVRMWKEDEANIVQTRYLHSSRNRTAEVQSKVKSWCKTEWEEDSLQ